MDSLNHFISQLSNVDINFPDPEKEWLKTLSGRLYSHLIQMSIAKGAALSIDGKGGPFEKFHFGTETAHLFKKMDDSTVGEDGGTIKTYVESWEYKRFPWWKKAIDLEGCPVIFLETPLSKLALDVHHEDLENLFQPAAVVKTYNLNPSSSFEKEIAAQHWVKIQIINLLNPLLDPHYEIKEYEQQLRLIPKTNEAKESRLIDNEAYQFALSRVRQIPDLLAQTYASYNK